MLRGWWVDCLPWVPFWLKCPGKHPPIVLFWHSWVASRMAWPLELAPFSSLRACRAFYGVEDPVWDAFIRAAGDPGDDYRLLAALPPAALAATTEAATMVSGEHLTVVQAAQVGLVYRLARRKLHVEAGLDIRLWVDPDPWADAPTATPPIMEPTDTSKALVERKMKFSAVLDQGDESEFVISSEEQKQRWLENFVRQTGGLPLEQEEPSTEQISALLRRVNSGGAPYADFSVWLPYGKKAHRTQKYRSYIPVMGGYITKEIPGPGSFDQWRASFRVYRTAMLMLDILTMATCVAYEAHVEKLDRLYPGAWHLIVAADDLGRSEHLVRLRVSVNLDIANGTKEPMGWAAENPWECLFRMLVKDSSFWAEQVHVPANAWLAHGSKGKPLTPAEAVAAASIQGGINAIKPDTESTAGTPSSTRRTRNARRREASKRKQTDAEGPTDAKKIKGDGKGKGKGKEKPQACYAWNNNNGACAGLPPGAACQGRVARAHVCTKCGSVGHPSCQCPQKDG